MATSGGELIRELRSNRDYSQEDLAAAVGVTNGAVGQWETGRTSPRRAVALRVDQVLDAGGRVMAAFGYAPITPPDDQGGWVSLEQHVRLQDQVETLAARVQELGAEVERLRKRADRVDV